MIFFQFITDYENTWINGFVNGCMQYTKQFAFVFEEALSFIKNTSMWWGHVASCVLIVIATLWWGYIALNSCIACTSSQCFVWIALILFFYFELQNVVAHYVIVIFEKFGLFSYDLLWEFLRILGGHVSFVAHLLVAFSKNTNFTKWHMTKKAKKSL